MQDLPKPEELIAAVTVLLRDEIMPAVSGAQQFQVRVAINALDLVTRQLAAADHGHVAEAKGLTALLGQDGPLDDQNRALCDAITAGSVSIATPGLTEHLWATTLAKLAVDQPTYAAYRREIER